MGLGSGQFANQRAKKAHLVRGGGVAGEVGDVRDDITSDFAANAAVAVEEFTNLTAADVDAFKASFASAAAAEDFSGAALDGAVGTGTISPPRNVTITTPTHADIDAVTVVITGKDVNNADISEDIVLTGGGGATDAGVKAFASVSRIEIPAQAGTGGALEVGLGDLVGLAKPIRTVAGLASLTREIAIGALVTTGTVADAATGAPNGTYSPSAAPNGTNDYAVYYDYAADQN